MPLEIMGPMVVLGIAGIALLLHLTGQTAPMRLQTEEDAHRAWLREHGEDAPGIILVAADGRAALLRLASGALGLVTAMGADPSARYLTGASWETTTKGLRIRLPDFAAPRFDIALSEDDRAAWLALKDQTT